MPTLLVIGALALDRPIRLDGPLRSGGRVRKIRCRKQGCPVEAIAFDWHDDVGMNSIVGDIDEGSLPSFPPVAVDRNHRTGKRCDKIERWECKDCGFIWVDNERE